MGRFEHTALVVTNSVLEDVTQHLRARLEEAIASLAAEHAHGVESAKQQLQLAQLEAWDSRSNNGIAEEDLNSLRAGSKDRRGTADEIGPRRLLGKKDQDLVVSKMTSEPDRDLKAHHHAGHHHRPQAAGAGAGVAGVAAVAQSPAGMAGSSALMHTNGAPPSPPLSSRQAPQAHHHHHHHHPAPPSGPGRLLGGSSRGSLGSLSSMGGFGGQASSAASRRMSQLAVSSAIQGGRSSFMAGRGVPTFRQRQSVMDHLNHVVPVHHDSPRNDHHAHDHGHHSEHPHEHGHAPQRKSFGLPKDTEDHSHEHQQGCDAAAHANGNHHSHHSSVHEPPRMTQAKSEPTKRSAAADRDAVDTQTTVSSLNSLPHCPGRPGRRTVAFKGNERARDSLSPSEVAAGDTGRVSMLSELRRDMEAEPQPRRLSELPQEFEVLPVWTARRRKTASVGTLKMLAFDNLESDVIQEKPVEFPNSCFLRFLQSFVVQPSKPKRLAWDVLGCIFIMWDVITIPLGLFQASGEQTEVQFYFDYISRVYWTMDIPFACITGVIYRDGTLELNVTKLFKRYARSWMAPDAVVVTFDWLEVFLDGLDGATAVRMSKTVRIIRTVRVLRLLRIAKIPIIHGTWVESTIRSEKVLLVAGMLKMFCGIIILMHFTGCMWWFIGSGSTLEDTWVIRHDMIKESLGYRYATSFHWSLCQFTGSMEINPVNFWERIYTILVLLCAYIVSNVFVSCITSSMTRLQMISGTKAEMITVLRQYLVDNGLSRRLMSRIMRSAHHAYEEFQMQTPEENIQLLKLVSEPLRVELHFELYSPSLCVHPFFQKYGDTNPAAMRRICHSAIGQDFLTMGDVLFVEGEVPQDPQMWFLKTGTVKYTRSSGGRVILKGDGPNPWIAEAVLWCQWLYCGLLRCDTDVRLLALHAETFQSICNQFSSSELHITHYATKYVERVNAAVKNNALSDMDEDNTAHDITEKIFRPDTTRDEDDEASKLALGKRLIRSMTKILGGPVVPRLSRLSRTGSQAFEARSISKTSEASDSDDGSVYSEAVDLGLSRGKGTPMQPLSTLHSVSSTEIEEEDEEEEEKRTVEVREVRASVRSQEDLE
eukprot:TRINITY_DN121745_c0_g1_i1.p1 TRINITY_DN121745_c0_g1~~TRINITY_DN121745_c0_g1_i1.p1  ORF type:complete len:1099 (-),score=264.01 TRINITY_DN121745_c0_g1_i1:280-3576(-)